MIRNAATLAAAAGMSLILTGATMADDPVEIVYASYLGPQHITNPVMNEFYKNVNRDSNGTITIQAHIGGSLLSGRDIPGGVRDGLADAGYFVGAYIPSEMPIDYFLSEFSLLNDDPLLMTAVLNDLVLFNCAECVEEYEKFNTKFLATYALTPYVYHCKEELTSLDDFRGKRVRGVSSYADLARGLGAVPVNVSPEEAYEALDTGILTCALHSIAAQKARSYGETAKFVILDSLGGFFGASTFNLRLPKWESLSQNQRGAITQNLAEMVSNAVHNYIDDDKSIIDEYTAKGTKFYNAEPEFAEFVATFAQEYTATAVEKGKTMGVKDPQAIATAIEELTEKWRKLLDENETDRDSFARLLHEEIFSKIDTSDDRG